MTNEIALLPSKETAVQVFSAENGLDPYLAAIRAEIDGFIPDISTVKGRKEIASIAYKVAQSKSALDNMGKELVAELKDVPRKIDAERKRMRDLLDMWKDEVRKPLTDWQNAEHARVDGHKATIGRITLFRQQQYFQSGNIQEAIDSLNSIFIDDSMQEFELEATREHKQSLEFLSQLLIDMQKREAEQAELERLRKEAAEREQKEREERIAREAAEQARINAERSAAAEQQRIKDEAERKEREAALAIERAQREKAEAELREQQAKERAERERAQAEENARIAAENARQEEIRRQQQEQQRIADEQAAREKDRKHKAAVNNQILADLMAQGLPEECAKNAIRAIASGKVSNVSIRY